MLVIVDYGVGNLGSLFNIFKRVGASPTISGDRNIIKSADKLVLPGVGAFDPVMKKFHESGLVDIISSKVLVDKTPILGVCVGMQMLGNGSDEGVSPGLGWIDAYCHKFSTDNKEIRVPHMGWNYVKKIKDNPLTNSLPQGSRFYFVHSYKMECYDPRDVLLTSNYGGEFVSAVQKENIIGTQFHPEKSHKFGVHFCKQFAEL